MILEATCPPAATEGAHSRRTRNVPSTPCGRQAASRLERYEDALRSIPPPGGNGCHPALLGVANLGIAADRPPDTLVAEIRNHIPPGTRRVTDTEIRQAVEKAVYDRGTVAPSRRPPPPRPQFQPKRLMHELIVRGHDYGEADVWEASPIRLDWSPEQDTVEILSRLYRPTDMLFLGERTAPGLLGETLRPVSDWLQHFRAGGTTHEHIIPNPLSGEQGRSKDGKPSYRADSCVAQFRFAVIEFDTLPRAEQLAFWWAVNLPVVALIDSAGKSIHGWVRVDCADAETWTRDVEARLFGQYLEPMGVDGNCRNESRLSRLPGHLRASSGARQRILYLCPEGRRVGT